MEISLKSTLSILLLAFLVASIFTNCSITKESTRLTKLSYDELGALIEDFNAPKISELKIKDFSGDSISFDSLKKIFIPGKHSFDYYKDVKGKILECKIRNHTVDDDAFEKELNRTKVKLSQKEMDEIMHLETSTQKSDYLHTLWKEDQKLRQGVGDDIMSKYGKYSDEHKKYLKESIEADGRIFIKLKTYLIHHGYPKKIKLYHKLALNAFPTIIGHNHNYDEQYEMIQYLYKSYKDGYGNIDDLVWIMGEMYEAIHNGKRYVMQAERYTVIEEFKELNNVLNLDFELNEGE